MKNITLVFLLLLGVFSISSCRSEDEDLYTTDIKIGKEETSLSQIHINPGSLRNILLSGGNGKYSVNVADSKIVDVKVSNDTLKVKGLFEGETFATIISHNKKVQLGIKVVPMDISISQDVIRLYPTTLNKVVSISGGGEIIDLKVNDPEKILSVKWNGSTGLLEILPSNEGDAEIIVRTANLPEKKLKVKVRAEGETKDIGIYSTTSHYIYPAIAPTMIAKRKNVGTWISGSTNPYGIIAPLYTKLSVRFSPIKNPVAGEYTNVDVQLQPFANEFKGITNGNNRLYVDEVRESTVVLRARGSRIVLPYEK